MGRADQRSRTALATALPRSPESAKHGQRASHATPRCRSALDGAPDSGRIESSGNLTPDPRSGLRADGEGHRSKSARKRRPQQPSRRHAEQPSLIRPRRSAGSSAEAMPQAGREPTQIQGPTQGPAAMALFHGKRGAKSEAPRVDASQTQPRLEDRGSPRARGLEHPRRMFVEFTNVSRTFLQDGAPQIGGARCPTSPPRVLRERDSRRERSPAAGGTFPAVTKDLLSRSGGFDVRAWSLSVITVAAIAAVLGFGGFPALVAIPARVLFFSAAVVLYFTAFAALIQRVQPRVY